MPRPLTAASTAALLTPYLAPRRDLSAVRPEARLTLTAHQVNAVFRPPEPHEVVVVWPKSELGPRPNLGCRFVDRAPRIGNYLYLRRPTPVGDRDGAYWCVKMRDIIGEKRDRWSTKRGIRELAGAVEEYIAYIDRAVDEHLNGVAPHARVVADVLVDFIRTQAARLPGADDIVDASFLAYSQAIRRVASFVDGWLIENITAGFTDAYMMWAKCHRPAGGGYAHNTARASVYALRYGLESILRDEGHRYYAPFRIPREELPGIEAFEADELLRIPQAAEHGWVWCRETGDWLTEVDETGARRRVKRRWCEARAAVPYGTLAFLGWVFGDRDNVNRRLTWDGTDKGPWIDVDNGKYYGLAFGEVAASGKLSGEREIPREHLPALRAMPDRDRARGIRHVVHTWDGRPLKEANYRVWKALLEAAGVEYRGLHALKHTCVMIMRISGVSRLAAAAYLCTLPHTLERYYGAYDAAVRREAVEALGSLDDYRRWCDETRQARREVAAVEAMAVNDNMPPPQAA